MSGQRMRQPSFGFNYRHVLVVLIAGWAARWLVAATWPENARSADFFSWISVAKLMWAGHDPYKDTTSLNWPPFWMQCIYFISRTTAALNVFFIHGVQFFLAAVESLVVVVLFGLIRKLAPRARPFNLVLLGIALNPVTILLICQHCNFDVIVALWVLLFVCELIRYYETGNEVDWLLACLFLGLGILTKTVPLVLCPMLAGGLRRVAWKTKWTGLTLVLGPVTLGMSIIYVLAPADVTSKVLGYRSTPGWFGVTGLLHMAGLDGLMGPASWVFYLALATVGVLTGIVFWRRKQMTGREIVMYATMFLAGTPALGPGYSPQYLYWFWPLLLLSYPLYDGIWRRVVITFIIVATVTCVVEYAIFPSHGQFFFYMANLNNVSKQAYNRLLWWISQPGQLLIRLPLFLAFLVLLTAGIRLLVQNPHPETLSAKPAAGKKPAK